MTEELPLRTTPTLTLPLKGRGNSFPTQSDTKNHLPPQGEGWDGGGVGVVSFCYALLEFQQSFKKFCVFPCVSVVKTVFEMASQ